MTNMPFFSASAMSQHLINDQIQRRTNAAMVAFQQQPVDARMQSPSIGDVHVWQAHETYRGERRSPMAGVQQAVRDGLQTLAADWASAQAQHKLSARERHSQQRA